MSPLRLVTVVVIGCLTLGGALAACKKRRKPAGGGTESAGADARPGAAGADAAAMGAKVIAGKIQAEFVELAAKLDSKDKAQRRKAYAELRRLALANTDNRQLATFLLGHRHPEFAIRGIKQWAVLRRRGKIDNKRFLFPMERLLAHEHDRVRREAIIAFFGKMTDPPLPKILAKVQARLDDKSCLVRHAAFSLLVRKSRAKEIALPLGPLVRGKLADPCPAVHAAAMRALHEAAKIPKLTPAEGKRLRALAQSPTFVARCEALRALGHYRVARARPLLAQGLTAPMETGLIVYSRSDGQAVPISFLTPHRFLPSCAADGLAALSGKPTLNPDPRRWHAKLAAAGKLPPPPQDHCVANHCAGGRVCLKLRCTALAKAAPAYWAYVKRRATIACKSKDKAVTRRWANQAGPAIVHAGFGLDRAGIARVLAHLARTDKGYAKKLAAARRCP